MFARIESAGSAAFDRSASVFRGSLLAPRVERPGCSARAETQVDQEHRQHRLELGVQHRRAVDVRKRHDRRQNARHPRPGADGEQGDHDHPDPVHSPQFAGRFQQVQIGPVERGGKAAVLGRRSRELPHGGAGEESVSTVPANEVRGMGPQVVQGEHSDKDTQACQRVHAPGSEPEAIPGFTNFLTENRPVIARRVRHGCHERNLCLGR